MKRMISMMLGVIFSGLIMLGSATLSFGGDRLQISGYGNAHTMDHNGMPKLLEVEDKTIKKDDPNDLFFQMREFSLFFDFEVSDGFSRLLKWKRATTPASLRPIMPMSRSIFRRFQRAGMTSVGAG